MNINIFIFFIFAVLFWMFFMFSPSSQNLSDEIERPSIELFDFSIYSATEKLLEHSLSGSEARKFETYYEVNSALFKDKTKPLLQTISADYAKYGDDILTLEKNIHYQRADNLHFRSSHGTYNTKTSVIFFPNHFIATKDTHTLNAEHLVYNSDTQIIKANNINASYKLK